MIFVAWLVVWAALFAVGIALVYSTGVRTERSSSSVAVVYFVVFDSAVPVTSWLVAQLVVPIEPASCEELDPSPERLNGASPSEFRTRCITAQDNPEWLARRKRALGKPF
jgi:hypothetical protein